MRFSRHTIYQLFTFCIIGLYCMHISSCANTKAAPSGGPKDTIPPRVLAILPDSNAINVPTKKAQITFTFDEYVQIKDAQKNIVLSPPQNKPIKTKIKGKSIVVSFQEDLDSNKTYSINFGSAIVDNNEGNVLQNAAYSFSTGKHIDSMLVSGTVMDYQTLLPIEGVTVALYEASKAKDSCVITTLPDAVTKSDKWGYFTVRNLKPVPYKVYAFTDINYNNKYDQSLEQVGFIDSLVTPTVVMKDNLPQLQIYDMKDTLNCLARPCEMDIYLFREKSNNQYIKDYKRVTERGSYIKFNAHNAVIDSFSIRGIRQDKIIKQFNITNDSLCFWIDEGVKLADTMVLGIKYLKTDTSGVLSPAVEKLKLINPVKKKKDKKTSQQKSDKRKDLLKFDINSEPSMVEQNGIVFTFTEPLVAKDFDSLKFTMSTPKKIASKQPFSVKVDSIEINKYILRPLEQFKVGNDYQLIIPKAAFKDINGFTNDSTNIKITLPTDDRLSSITLDVKNISGRYIIELVNDKRDKVYRKYIISSNQVLEFPYLQKGTYSIRITEDKNNNEQLDPGDVLLNKQPEKVLLYKLPDGTSIIKLDERTDVEQTVDVAALFSK